MSTISNAVAVLNYVASHPGNASIRTLAASLGLSKSTAHRIVRELEEAGFLQRDPNGGQLSLGVQLLFLGRAYLDRLDLWRAAIPLLRELRDQTGETVGLCVPMGDQRVFLEQFPSPHILLTRPDVSRPYPLYAGAPGKVLLSSLPSSEVERVLAAAASVLDEQRLLRLRRELPVIRQLGYATGFEETVPGVSSVAAPVRDYTGRVVAAVSLTGPSARFDREAMMRQLPALLHCCQELSRLLGYRGDVDGREKRPG